MIRYKNVPSIEFNLKYDYSLDYSVKADFIYSKTTNKYYVSLHIRHNQIHQWNLMGRFENTPFDSDIKTIKSDIADYVTALVEKKELNYYIMRCEYEQKCFDRGNALFEEERLKTINESRVIL